MKLLKLTAPNGEPVWIVPSWIVRICKNHDDTSAPTLITLSGEMQTVREPLRDVVALVEGV